MSATLRTRFRVVHASRHFDDNGKVTQENVQLTAVRDDGTEANQVFARLVPSGSLNLTLQAEAIGTVTQGEVWLDLTPVTP